MTHCSVKVKGDYINVPAHDIPALYFHMTALLTEMTMKWGSI